MSDSDRSEFLFHVYDQAHANINRQFGLAWQSAGLVAAAVGVFAFTEQQNIASEIPTTLFIVVAASYAAHLIDANSWFNRNLLIIANVERTFLTAEDEHRIHPFFLEHRKNKMLGHLRIQFTTIAVLISLVLWYHEHKHPLACVNFTWWVPYIVAGLAALLVLWVWIANRCHYAKLRRRSPGPGLRHDGG
jgi:hypothetical protein